VLTLREGNWIVEIPIDLSAPRDGPTHTPRWLISTDPVQFAPARRGAADVTVSYRPHSLSVSLTHQVPAYLDEEYPIVIGITNEDDRALDVILDILLQPSEIDEAVNVIRVDDEHSQNLIKGIAIGSIAPGATTLKTLYLTSTGGVGDRVLDISIQSRSPVSRDTSEVLRTLSVPTVASMSVAYGVKYLHAPRPLPGLTDMHTYESDYWDDSEGGEALINARMTCTGPWGLSVETVRLSRKVRSITRHCVTLSSDYALKNGPHAKVLECSLDGDEDDVTSDWLPGDEFAAVCRVDLSLEDEPGENDAISGPGEFVLLWRRILPNGDHGPLNTSRFPLPDLLPPRPGVVALLELPPSAKLHNPIHAYLTIRNHHPARTANLTVQLEPDAADSFLVAGQRSARVPMLLPGAEIQLAWSLVPIECGFVRIPKIRVTDKRKTVSTSPTDQPPATEDEGVPVPVVAPRRSEKIVIEVVDGADPEGAPSVINTGGIGPILVLP
jgi:hypothetical protein